MPSTYRPRVMKIAGAGRGTSARGVVDDHYRSMAGVRFLASCVLLTMAMTFLCGEHRESAYGAGGTEEETRWGRAGPKALNRGGEAHPLLRRCGRSRSSARSAAVRSMLAVAEQIAGCGEDRGGLVTVQSGKEAALPEGEVAERFVEVTGGFPASLTMTAVIQADSGRR